MRVSLNLAQYYSNVDIKGLPRDELVKRVGAQLGAVEEVIDWAPRYKGVVVVKVVSVDQHPNADRLHVCLVDDRGVTTGVKRDAKGLVQVVCGAPNVHEGMFAAWIPPGATVPSSYGTNDPFVLDARELRGVVSNGMLASPKELGINDDHDGILDISDVEIGHNPKPGEPITNYYGLDDFIIDCENKMFTHRPDCFGNIGVARELAGISGLNFKSPDWYLDSSGIRSQGTGSNKITIKNEAGKLVPRFSVATMNDIEVGKSPVWLQSALTRIGMKPINNVVDITNYVMHLTGQPLHAFDYDKLPDKQLSPRLAKKGEKLALLNGKTIELSDEDIVISSGGRAVALAGIMGGSETEVDEHTKNIVLECATFDMYAVRRSSMRHGLFTDASTRFTKGQSPLQNARVLAYAVKLMTELAGTAKLGHVYDEKGAKLAEPNIVTVDASFINERLGANLTVKEVANLLERTEFEILSVPAGKDKLHIRPPFWRMDIEIGEDVVEEVGRLYGFEKLPQALPPRSAKPAPKNPGLELKTQLRQRLASFGANEVLTYSFVHGDLMNKVGQDLDDAFHLRNAISPGLQYYRTSLLPSLLSKVHANIKADYVRNDDNEFAIFEIGKSHVKGLLNEEKLPAETEVVAFVLAADDKTATRKYEGSAFYAAKKYLTNLLPEDIELESVDVESKDLVLSHMLAPFDVNRTAALKHNGKTIGFVGEFKNTVTSYFKLPRYCAGFEFDISSIKELDNKVAYSPIGNFPKSQQDITLEVEADMQHAKVKALLHEATDKLSAEHGYNFTLQDLDIYRSEKSGNKRLSFRVWLSHPARTLTTNEVNRLLDGVAAEAEKELNAKRI